MTDLVMRKQSSVKGENGKLRDVDAEEIDGRYRQNVFAPNGNLDGICGF